MSRPNYLFASNDLRTDLENHHGRMLDQIRSIDPEEFLKTSPDDLAELLIDEFTVDVPVLGADEDISVTQRETQVDVSQDRQRAIFDRSRPVFVIGTEVNVSRSLRGGCEPVPKRGVDALKCRPHRCRPGKRAVAHIHASRS